MPPIQKPNKTVTGLNTAADFGDNALQMKNGVIEGSVSV